MSEKPLPEWQGQVDFVLSTSQILEKAQGGECYLWNTHDSNEDKTDRILNQFKTSNSDYRAFRSLL